MRTFRLNIQTMKGGIIEEGCESAVIPTVDGMYGVMAGHSNVISVVAPGTLSYSVGGERHSVEVGKGVLVVDGGCTTLLVDSISGGEL